MGLVYIKLEQDTNWFGGDILYCVVVSVLLSWLLEYRIMSSV